MAFSMSGTERDDSNSKSDAGSPVGAGAEFNFGQSQPSSLASAQTTADAPFTMQSASAHDSAAQSFSFDFGSTSGGGAAQTQAVASADFVFGGVTFGGTAHASSGATSDERGFVIGSTSHAEHEHTSPPAAFAFDNPPAPNKREYQLQFITPLHLTAHPALAELLINANAELDAQDVTGRTPLMNHVTSSNLGVLRLLLERGADPFIERQDGKQAVEMTITPECDSVLRDAMIRSLSSVLNTHTPLAAAARCVAIVVSFVVLTTAAERYKSEVQQAVSQIGRGSVMVQPGAIWRVHQLIAQESKSGEHEREGVVRTALTAALWPSLTQEVYHTDRVAQLIQLKADVNARNHERDTPLHKCTRPELLRLLVTAKADVNGLDRDGFTSLFTYCRFSRNDLIQPILDAKADANLSGIDSRGCYDYADPKYKAKIRHSILASLLPLLTAYLTKDTAGEVLSFIAPPVVAVPPSADRVLIKARRRR